MQNHYDDIPVYFIVTFTEEGSRDVEKIYTCWADDHVDACERAEKKYPALNCIVLVETEEEYEARTGRKYEASE